MPFVLTSGCSWATASGDALDAEYFIFRAFGKWLEGGDYVLPFLLRCNSLEDWFGVGRFWQFCRSVAMLSVGCFRERTLGNAGDIDGGLVEWNEVDGEALFQGVVF